MTWNYIISVIMLVGDVIKLCNLVSKVPVCMADRAKLLVAALQCRSSVNYTKLKLNKVNAKSGAPCSTGWFTVPGIGWLSQAPDWLIPRWMMQSGCNLRCCLRKQGGDGLLICHIQFKNLQQCGHNTAIDSSSYLNCESHNVVYRTCKSAQSHLFILLVK